MLAYPYTEERLPTHTPAGQLVQTYTILTTSLVQKTNLNQQPSHKENHSTPAGFHTKRQIISERQLTYEPLPQKLFGLNGPGLRLLFLSAQAGCLDAG